MEQLKTPWEFDGHIESSIECLNCGAALELAKEEPNVL